jgi:hypothetical protein
MRQPSAAMTNVLEKQYSSTTPDQLQTVSGVATPPKPPTAA